MKSPNSIIEYCERCSINAVCKSGGWESLMRFQKRFISSVTCNKVECNKTDSELNAETSRWFVVNIDKHIETH